MQLALLVERLPRRRPVHRLLAALPGQLRLGKRVAPLAVELHDPRAMREAAARERDQLRLSVAPAGQRVGPLLGAPQLERLLAARDHAAVDDAGDDRRDLVGGDADHRLVQEPEAFVDASPA